MGIAVKQSGNQNVVAMAEIAAIIIAIALIVRGRCGPTEASMRQAENWSITCLVLEITLPEYISGLAKKH